MSIICQGLLTGQDDDVDNIPELPDRKYLQDIVFVAQEFDLILRRPPDIPSRLTDKEGSKNVKDGIDLKVIDSGEHPAMETSHYMSLLKAQESDNASSNTYQSLKIRKQPSISVNVCEESFQDDHYQSLSNTTKNCDSSLYQSLSNTTS